MDPVNGLVPGAIDTDPLTTCVAFHENQRGEVTVNDTAGSLKVGGGKPGQGYPAVAFDMRGREGGAQMEGPHDTANIRAASGGSSRSYVAACDVADTLSVGANQTTGFKGDVISQNWAVRRLTPRECERLQGFPDGYTDIAWRGKDGAPDGPRYKALGNSMAVNVMRWIGRRIQAVEDMEHVDSAKGGGGPNRSRVSP